ncbi:hypothetical protein ACWA5Z_07015 [Testudinibacter sp. P80/BLE/0925]|uniref:hypothetical protein n=1 Tax=Testudinibacter sp. TW-1 TaxID=3417757 RepID=UPI003D3674CA
MAINLLDWRTTQLRRQQIQFVCRVAISVLIGCGLLHGLHGYQQRLQHELAQQRQQQTALRQQNQDLQRQIQQLQAQTDGKPPSESAVIDAENLALFLNLLRALPLQDGRLTFAGLTPSTPPQTQLALHGYTLSAHSVEQLKAYLAQALPTSATLELTRFELAPAERQDAQFTFVFQIQLIPEQEQPQ